MKTALLAILLCYYTTTVLSQINYTANELVSSYEGPFRAGINFGDYAGFDEIQQANLAAGNQDLQLEGMGVKAVRPGLFEDFLEVAGYDTELSTYAHYDRLDLKDNTLIVGFPSDEHRDPTFYCPQHQSTLFANMYEPIWDNGEYGTPINENNYYALYLYKTATLYKDYIRFYEIWNEPGFDYTGALGWFPEGEAGNWWDNNPDPCDYKLRAPIFHYVRLLRISWEVIKTVDPEAYIVVSGTGFLSFLDAILRNTDNPEDGSVTADYPLGGGAYFDVMGFHSYPHFDGSLRTWNNDIQDWNYSRHSDAAAQGIIATKDSFQMVLNDYGYNDELFPKKEWIVTECNLPRRPFDDFIGSEESQRNFIPKAVVQCMKNNIHQLHLYKLAEDTKYDEATFEFDVMGLYEHLDFRNEYFQTPTQEGIAYKTSTQLLFNKRFDEARTAQLDLPEEVDGGAFSDTDGNYTYVLWAKTQIDQSENASATYSFPNDWHSNGLIKREWDYSQSHTQQEVNPEAHTLTATPVFFTEKKISATTMFGCAPLNVQFQIENSSNATQWNWIFEGGTPALSSSLNPTITYSAVGAYPVRLTLLDANNNVLATQEQTITVEALASPSFIATTTGPISIFNNTSSLDADHFLWDFGDGTTSTIPSPMHVFYESGNYEVVLTAVNECGSATATQDFQITVPTTTQIDQTANEFVPNYSAPFRPGSNFKFYENWRDEQLADIAAGNPHFGIPGVGVKSFRSLLPHYFLNGWGYDIRLETYQHYQNLDIQNNTAVIGIPSTEAQDTMRYCPDYPSTVFKDIYLDIWDNGENGTPINDDNDYAVYLYHTVNTYKDYITFWEIWNSPGFDHSGEKGWLPPGEAGNWWENNPDPCDYELRAPIFHYIRLLRISYEIIKTLDPDGYVTVSGIGFPSFLDAILRNTDNPSDGSIATNYTKKGGAYFDAIGFNSFPHIDGSTSYYDLNIGGFAYERHSDAAISGIVNSKATFENVLLEYGYNGDTYPEKIWMIGESNLPRKAIGQHIGSTEAQRNFIIKAYVTSVLNDIKQFNVFSLAEDVPLAQAGTPTQSMGLYETLNQVAPYEQIPTPEGLAYKTVSDLLFGKIYDANKTQAMNLPDHISGAAFEDTNNKHTYILWAKTQTDRSEEATANYSFPTFFNINQLYQRNWNWSITHEVTEVDIQNIALTGTPIFLSEEEDLVAPPVAAFEINATKACPNDILQLSDLSQHATSWFWEFPGAIVETSTLQHPTISYSNSGIYSISLTVTNESGSHQATYDSYVEIFGHPVANYTFEMEAPWVYFTNQSEHATDYTWEFGDDSESSGFHPNHFFFFNGEYDVALIAENVCAIDTMTQLISIQIAPTARFMPVLIENCADLRIKFLNQSYSSPESQTWTFPNGTPAVSTDFSPNVTFDAPGTYPITLIVNNDIGSDTLTQHITVGYPETTFRETLCAGESLEINGIVYDENQPTGTQFFSEITDLGCDSTLLIELDFREIIPTTFLIETIQEGESYLFGHEILTESGIYNEIFPSNHGCDSLVQLDLTVEIISNLQETAINLFHLQAYPNPFRNELVLSFDLKQQEKINIEIFDLNGRLIKTLAKEVSFKRGKQKIVWQQNDLATGVYWCRFTTSKTVASIKVVKYDER